MALDLTYILTLKDAGDKSFVMPSGFDANVEIHCWGAGGGGTIGVLGGGGGYASTIAQIPVGSVVRLQVGQPGTNGDRQTGGIGGTNPTYTKYRGGSAGSAYDEDWDMGAGGGGGGASAVVIDNSPLCIGAGGGGAGGPGDDSGAGNPGNPGGVYPGTATDIYPVTLSYAWCQFMNDYAVWGPVNPFSTTVNFPVTGTYSFAFAVDNYGSIKVDGSDVISLSGTVTSHFTEVHYANVTVNSGNHTITVSAVNTGGPAGVAVRILKPDLSELTNSRNYTVNGGLTDNTDGGTSVNAWASGGGGGGGYFGGLPGTSYGDDSGNAPGGNGGQNYGYIIESGSGSSGAGKSTTYYPTVPPHIGDAGYPGYIVMKFTRKPGLRIKSPDGSGDWVDVINSYVRTNDPRPGLISDHKIFSTVGTTSYTIPKEVRTLTITYLTAAGLVSDIIPVIPGRTLPITIGDFGQTSAFGDYIMPAYSKEVFHYIGNVDHLLNADVQIANASGDPLTTGGYNAGQTAAAAAMGLYYNVTYEGWHGDLYSTLYFNPVRTDQLLNNFQIVGSGGGRAGGPGITAQPTVANGYIMGIQMYDPYSSEGGYNTYFTLQQQGYFRIDYELPIIISGWKDIQNIFVKNDEVWKSISQQSDIVITNYTYTPPTATRLDPSSSLLYTYNIISGQGGTANGGEVLSGPAPGKENGSGFRSGDRYFPVDGTYGTQFTNYCYPFTPAGYVGLATFRTQILGTYSAMFSSVSSITSGGGTDYFTAVLNSGYHFYVVDADQNARCFMNSGQTITFKVSATQTSIYVGSTAVNYTGTQYFYGYLDQGLVWKNTTGLPGSVNVIVNVSGVSKAMGYRVLVDGTVVALQSFGETTSSFSGPLGPFSVTATSSVLFETYWWGTPPSFTNSSYISSGTFSIGAVLK